MSTTVDCMQQRSRTSPGGMAAIGDLGDTVAVWAHPDDETYLCGGIMAALRDLGHRVVCITATRGENGGQAPPEALAAVRAGELAAALGVLGVEEHRWLDLPDGSLAAVEESMPTARLTEILREVRPRTVLTFGPDGLTGHPDHVTVGRWARSAFVTAGVPGSRLLEAASTPCHRSTFGELERQLGVHIGEPPAPTPDHDLALRIVLDELSLDRKVGALLFHATQTRPLAEALGLDVFRAWVATEAFRPAPRVSPVQLEREWTAGRSMRTRFEKRG